MNLFSLAKIDGLKLWMTVVVLMTAVAVFAEEGPCKQDAERLCAGVKAGGGAIRKCLREKRAELSDACKAKIHEAHERRVERRREHREHHE